MGFKMKYAITPAYLTAPSKRRRGIPINGVWFVVAHDTGNPKSTARNNRDFYERTRDQEAASAHIFVDDKEILEVIPALTAPPEKAWHVSYNEPKDNWLYGGDANDYAIGVEWCYGGNINNDESYRKYVWTLAYICYRFGLDPAKAITGHFILDPGNRSDPKYGLNYTGRTWEQLLKDVVQEYYNCLDEEEIEAMAKIVLQDWQAQLGYSAIDSLGKKVGADGKPILNSPEDWKAKLQRSPEKVLNDLPWLIFVLLDRITK